MTDLVASRISETDLVLQIFRSLEFSLGEIAGRINAENWHPQAAMQVAVLGELLRNFKRYSGPGQPGFYLDFLGTRTRTRYVPEMRQYDNQVVTFPIEGPPLLFETAEWEGILRSVLEAKTRLVAIELGAGWAPWLVTCFAAARQRGIGDIQLAGVEASDEHFSYMVQHLRDNGIDPGQHYLFKGVIGVSDGYAYFPRLVDADKDWGAQAVLTGAGVSEEALTNYTDYRGLTHDTMDSVPSLALSTLLQRYARVDVIHCDIQDSEGEVLPCAMDELSSRVRRVVVGTHSRKSEGALLEAFSARGWILEADTPCRYVVEQNRTMLVKDGVQVWANRALAPS